MVGPWAIRETDDDNRRARDQGGPRAADTVGRLDVEGKGGTGGNRGGRERLAETKVGALAPPLLRVLLVAMLRHHFVEAR